MAAVVPSKSSFVSMPAYRASLTACTAWGVLSCCSAVLWLLWSIFKQMHTDKSIFRPILSRLKPILTDCTVKSVDFLYDLLSFVQYFSKLFVLVSVSSFFLVFFVCRYEDVLLCLAVKWLTWNFVFSCEHVVAKFNVMLRLVYCE